MNIHEISKLMTYEASKKDIRPGDYVKQRHWPDIPSNWYRVLTIKGNTLELEYAKDPLYYEHSGGITTYPITQDWIIKRIVAVSPKVTTRTAKPLPFEECCHDCGVRVGGSHKKGCISRADEGVKAHAPMSAQALRRFPTHPSDILILLNDI